MTFFSYLFLVISPEGQAQSHTTTATTGQYTVQMLWRSASFGLEEQAEGASGSPKV